jgi:hypothetical protein
VAFDRLSKDLEVKHYQGKVLDIDPNYCGESHD